MAKYSRLPDITPNYKNSCILFVMSRSQVRVPSQAPARCPRSRFRGSDVLSREFFSALHSGSKPFHIHRRIGTFVKIGSAFFIDFLHFLTILAKSRTNKGY